MSNYNTFITAENVLKCSKKDFNALSKIWEPKGYDEDGFELESSGLNLSFDAGEKTLYIYSDEGSGDIERLPAEALTKLGQIIEAAGAEYLEFGIAHVCDRPRPGSAGGGAFRVYSDGTVKYPARVWE